MIENEPSSDTDFEIDVTDEVVVTIDDTVDTTTKVHIIMLIN